MRIARTGSASAANIFSGALKTGIDYRRIFCSSLAQEIVMTSSCKRVSVSSAARAVSIVAAVLWSDAVLASQGPGGGMGTASHPTQLAMAIIVYGISAIVVGAGLIGAVRGR
jgi:hypothetical protein